MMTTKIGEVCYDLPLSAAYVQVLVPGQRHAFMATCDGFDWKLFKTGRVVEVRESHMHNQRDFAVTRVFDEVRKKPIVLNYDFRLSAKSSEEFKSGTTTKLSEPGDRTVRFWISSRYSKDVATQLAMYRVLVSALSMEENEANGLLMCGGFRVICRESQFARFLIKRNEEGLPNLFQDLRVEYYTSKDSRPEINVSDR